MRFTADFFPCFFLLRSAGCGSQEPFSLFLHLRHAGMRFTADFSLIFGGLKPYACYLLQFIGDITDYPSVEQVDGPLRHSRIPL